MAYLPRMNSDKIECPCHGCSELFPMTELNSLNLCLDCIEEREEARLETPCANAHVHPIFQNILNNVMQG